jgi:hypothetical protein
VRRLALLLPLGLLVLAPEASADPQPPRAERVLVLSLPTVSWEDVNDQDLPNLDPFLDGAAVAGLSTRAVDRRTTPGDGYATLSAGTRADGDDDVDGLAFEVGERYQGEPADQVFLRRTGTPVERGLFSLALPALEDVNEGLDFDAEIGALGDALLAGGAHPAVVANADGAEEALELVYNRPAVTGLMSSDGIVPGGRVGVDLLEQEKTAPFGQRLDNEAVEQAFQEAWVEDAVVLVEASDLVRADAYRDLTTSEQQARHRREALDASDELLGRLLEHVNPRTDAVLVVGPYHSDASNHLTIAALQAPGLDPGLLRSAVTRRTGFVTLVDVAPTILELLDLEIPDSMEGRPFERSAGGGSAEDRRTWLEEADLAAQWRDTMVTPVAVAFVLAQVVLWLLALRALSRNSPRSRRGVEAAALGVLSVLPLTYLAGFFPFHEWGAWIFWLYLILGGALLGVLAQGALRRWPGDPLLGVLGLILVLLLVDTVLGARLQLNTVFGYTPTVAGRFAGIGNLAFAQLAAAATILAGLVASRVGGRKGAFAALGIVLLVFVIDASPFWGSDVGGALTLVPTVAALAVVLFGLELRWRTVVVVGAATLTVFLVAGFVDLARPEESRTHLGRLFEDIADNGVSAFETVVVRKIGANLAVLASSEWTLMLPIVFGFVLYLIWRAPWRLQHVRQVVPRERAARVAFVIAAILGFAFNDSGIAVPGLMLGVINAALVYLVLRTEDEPWRSEVNRRSASNEVTA